MTEQAAIDTAKRLLERAKFASKAGKLTQAHELLLDAQEYASGHYIQQPRDAGEALIAEIIALDSQVQHTMNANECYSEAASIVDILRKLGYQAMVTRTDWGGDIKWRPHSRASWHPIYDRSTGWAVGGPDSVERQRAQKAIKAIK